MKIRLLTILFVSMTIGAGWAAQPTLKDATVEPAVAAPGDAMKIQIEFKGDTKKVKSVTLMVREYPYEGPTMDLKPVDDKKRNLWVLESNVPWDAPSESFHLDIGAVDYDSKPIITEGFEDNWTGKTGTIEFEVK